MTTISPAGLATGRWAVDPAQSTAAFRVGNLGRIVTGTVPIIEGTVDVDDRGQPSAISGSLDLAAIGTGHARRDKDLRQPRFLDLDSHPTMTFAADSIAVTSAGWQITGQLAVRGTSVRLTGQADMARRDRSAIVIAHTRLDRRALGIRVPRIMIGRVVSITVTATLRPATPP